MIRSAAEVDAEIRALFESGAPFDREAYHRLVVEWARAYEAERAARPEAA